MSQFAYLDKIKDQENLFGSCLIESSSAILVVGNWPSFYTDEGSALFKDFFSVWYYRKAVCKKWKNPLIQLADILLKCLNAAK